jgi:hypothetical protein
MRSSGFRRSCRRSPNVVTQIPGRLREDDVHLAGAGEVAGCVLRSFECLYTNGTASYFQAIAGALDALVERDYHLPRADAVRALRDTAQVLAGQNADVDAAIAAYADRVVAAAHITAPRLGNGVFVMTTHQAKGKEFDTVILANPLERHYPDTEEGRKGSTSQSRARRRAGSSLRQTRTPRLSCRRSGSEALITARPGPTGLQKGAP